jgi:hypothetical protein
MALVFGGDNGETLVFRCDRCGEWEHVPYTEADIVNGKYRAGLVDEAHARAVEAHNCGDDTPTHE